MHWVRRIALVAGAALLTLGLLLGGQWLYKEQFRRQPLADALMSIPGVRGVNVLENSGPAVIDVRLGAVDNLQQTYGRLEQAARGDYSEFRLQLADSPDQALESAWDAAQYPVYQAAARGDFSSMAAELDRISRARGLTWKAFLDDRNIYVQMADGDHYLYRVVALRLPPSPATAGKEGQNA